MPNTPDDPNQKPSDQNSSDNVHPFHRAAPCPICDKPSTAVDRPFCSKRCADLDLGKWLNGSYAIPVVETDAGTSDGEVPEQGTISGNDWDEEN